MRAGAERRSRSRRRSVSSAPARKFTAKRSSCPSRLSWRVVASGRPLPMPALLTSTSRRSVEAATSSASARTSSSAARSARCVRRRPLPVARAMASRAAASRPASRPWSSTVAPWAARRSATARPSPSVAPVTSTVSADASMRARIIRRVSVSGSVRRRQAGILLVGAIEPQAQPWLRAAGHATRAVRDAGAALAALDDEPVDLVVADREPAGLDAEAVCGALREHPRFGEAWLLAIAPRRAADAVLRAGADDYVQRPFTRAELLARTNVGVRAARQRSDDSLLRALLVNVPGAIYRSAWHAGHTLELISDEIERISGYPPDNFI